MKSGVESSTAHRNLEKDNFDVFSNSDKKLFDTFTNLLQWERRRGKLLNEQDVLKIVVSNCEKSQSSI
jgi:hypothetical protein